MMERTWSLHRIMIFNLFSSTLRNLHNFANSKFVLSANNYFFNISIAITKKLKTTISLYFSIFFSSLQKDIWVCNNIPCKTRFSFEVHMFPGLWTIRFSIPP